MIVKEVYLEQEKEQIKKFLQENELEYDKLIDKTLYIEENSRIIGTISYYQDIVKCLAIDKEYQNENLASLLVNEVIKLLSYKDIHHIFVYTKTKYAKLFESLSFTKITSTTNTVILEYGNTNIKKTINQVRKQIESKFDINVDNESISCVVVNANPPTLGHQYLIETASKMYPYVIVFVLEEDLSYFTFKERMSLVYLMTMYMPNVIVLPSTRYLVSSLTFPTYFLKEESKYEEWAKIDAQIFNEYFIPSLNIKKRFVGTESSKIMITYNNYLKEILKDKLEIIERLDNISASNVRKEIQEGNIMKALESVPKSIKALLYNIIQSKHDK